MYYLYVLTSFKSLVQPVVVCLNECKVEYETGFACDGQVGGVNLLGR